MTDKMSAAGLAFAQWSKRDLSPLLTSLAWSHLKHLTKENESLTINGAQTWGDHVRGGLALNFSLVGMSGAWGVQRFFSLFLQKLSLRKKNFGSVKIVCDYELVFEPNLGWRAEFSYNFRKYLLQESKFVIFCTKCRFKELNDAVTGDVNNGRRSERGVLTAGHTRTTF